IGATQSPLNSWLLIQTLETLALRVDKHSDNALVIAKFLESHPVFWQEYIRLLHLLYYLPNLLFLTYLKVVLNSFEEYSH
ncbi:PLP-dependent transferase, partial [Aliarcobacter butzleri]|uniref:PLP-dependent transferase n=1 Tax=Aliarcobacter butzleri TaxID=28197 RepID=UPI003417D766